MITICVKMLLGVIIFKDYCQILAEYWSIDILGSNFNGFLSINGQISADTGV